MNSEILPTGYSLWDVYAKRQLVLRNRITLLDIDVSVIYCNGTIMKDSSFYGSVYSSKNEAFNLFQKDEVAFSEETWSHMSSDSSRNWILWNKKYIEVVWFTASIMLVHKT